MGANKKYKAHISKYVRHILKYLRHIFRPLKIGRKLRLKNRQKTVHGKCAAATPAHIYKNEHKNIRVP